MDSRFWDILQNHLSTMTPVELTRRMGGVTLTASVAEASSDAWTVAMLVGLKIDSGKRSTRQWFESVQAAKRAAEKFLEEERI